MRSTVFISRIDPNPLNERSMNQEDIEIMAESIRRDGLFEVPVVYPKGERYVLLSGHRRVNALAMLGEAKTEVNIVPAPATPSEEQEILAEANIHRSTPEELRTEVKLAQRAWNTMAKERRAKLREEYLQRFKAASTGIPAYDADPDRYISANFRPVHDYIRQITGLTASNSTIKRCLMDLVPEESRPEEKKTVRPVTAADVQRRAEALAGTITLYRTDDPDLMLAMQDTLDMTERLIEQLGKETK